MNKARIATITLMVLPCILLMGCGKAAKPAGSAAEAARRADVATPSPPELGQEAPPSAGGRSAAKQQTPARKDKDENGGDGEIRTLPSTPQHIEKSVSGRNAARIADDAGPDGLSHWLALAASHDYSIAASNGDARAQLLYGLSLINNDLVTVEDRLPLLSSIPVIGKKMFVKTQCFIDVNASPDQVAAAYQWVRRSCDQNFSPAIEAKKLFNGTADPPSPTISAMESAGQGK